MKKISDSLYAFNWQSFRENNCNTFFINREKKILIDPGHDHLFSHVADKLGELGIQASQLDYVLITHGHPDHLEAAFRLRPPSSMAMSPEEWRFITPWISGYNLSPPDLLLEEGNITLGDVTLEVYHTPGHSPGSVCLYWPEQKALFTGDVIFNQGIGRVDLPGGDGKLLKESIRKLKSLDVEILLSGHGEILVGKEGVQENFRFIEDYWFRYI